MADGQTRRSAAQTGSDGRGRGGANRRRNGDRSRSGRGEDSAVDERGRDSAAQAPPAREQESNSSSGSDDSPGGLTGLVQRRLESWSLDSIDPEFARRQLFLWNFVQDHYFRMDIEGWHRLPDPPTMIVGVHAAGIFPVEAWMFGLHWTRRFGDKRIMHGTAHDALIATPIVGEYFTKMGVMSASPDKVETALEAGRDVAVYPGGDIDSLRPWTQRDEVKLGGRRGFVKMAIKCGVPIVPLAASGGMDTMFTLPGGRTIARALGLKQLARIESMPLAAGLPWGIAPGVVPFLPLPAKLRIELLDPLFISDDPERADDDEYVDEIYREVEYRIEQGVGRLARRRSFPIFG